MITVQNANVDWRDSLYALNNPAGFKFVFSKQIRRGAPFRLAQGGAAAIDVQTMAAAGNSVAMELIGADYLEPDAPVGVSEKGAEWLLLSASSGNPVAMQQIAERWLSTDASRMAADAQSLLERAASDHYLPAQVALAAYLLEGPLAPNPIRATELLRDSAARGSRLAHVVMATSLITGRGVQADHDAGVGWLRRLGANNARKVGALGTFLYASALASRFPERRRLTRYAAVLFEESINQGNFDVETSLAYLIRRG